MNNTTKTLTSSDITACIGRKIVRARLTDGTWVRATVTSAFLAPFTATVVRTLTDAEALQAEAEIA